MIKIAIVGYGNVGKGVHESIARNSDIELAGIVSRDPERVVKEGMISTDIYSQTGVLEERVTLNADVAILCGGSKNDLPTQGPAFANMFNTVDSFDTHSKIPEYFRVMNGVATTNKNTAVICAGWDPGTFSVNRVLADAFIPGCVPKGFYGLAQQGGLSMGHSDAVRQINGVLDARQYTHAIPEAIDQVRRGENPDLPPEQMHWREVYVVAEDNADKSKIEQEIRNMPGYFENHQVQVHFVSKKELRKDMPHDGVVLAIGETGNGNPAAIEYKNQWANNAEATGNVLVACARAAYSLSKQERYGAYTMLDLSPADLSPHSRGHLLKKFM